MSESIVVHAEHADVDSMLPEGSPRLVDGVDPDLLELPAPARGRRAIAMAMMALSVIASLALLSGTRRDIAYFFSDSAPTRLGEAVDVRASSLAPNTFVAISGTPMASGTIEYERILGTTRYQLFPLAGQRTVFVQVPVGSDPGRREFSGRLVTFGALERFASLREHLEHQTGASVADDAFVLLADQPPGSYVWSLGLAGLCGLFILLNLLLLARWFRPIRLV